MGRHQGDFTENCLEERVGWAGPTLQVTPRILSRNLKPTCSILPNGDGTSNFGSMSQPIRPATWQGSVLFSDCPMAEIRMPLKCGSRDVEDQSYKDVRNGPFPVAIRHESWR